MRDNIDQKQSRLFGAITGGYPVDVISALNAGADVDMPLKEYGTPAVYACKIAHLDAFDVLVHYGADLSIPNTEGETVQSILKKHIENCKSSDDVEYYASRLNIVEECLKNPRSKNATKLWSKGTQFELGEALVEAAKEGNFKKVQLLIEKGANVLHQNAEGHDALEVADYFNHEQVFSYLADKINLSQSFIAAIYDGDTNRAKRYLDKGAHPMSYDRYGNLGVLVAAEKGNYKLVKHLIDRGVDVNVEDSKGNTLMNYAVRTYDCSMVDYLIEKGFNYARHNNNMRQDVEIAMHSKDNYILQKLVKTKQKTYEFMLLAVEQGADTALDYFISIGGRPKDCDSWVYPWITKAVESRNPKVVDILLKNGMYTDRIGSDGKWALLEAVKVGNPEIMKLLLRNKPNIDVANKTGWTALMEACKLGNQQMAKMLIEAGADVDKKDIYGWTPMMVAARHGEYKVAGELYVAETDILAQNNEGKTALYIAVENNQVDMARHLLFWGANVEMKGQKAPELLSLALEKNQIKLIDDMVSYSGQVDMRLDKLGKTALQQAIKNRQVDVVQMLLDKGANPRIMDDSMRSALDMAKAMFEYSSRTDMDVRVRNIFKMVELAAEKQSQKPPVLVTKSQVFIPYQNGQVHQPE